MSLLYMFSAFQPDATIIKSLHPTKDTHKDRQIKHLPAIHYTLKPQAQDSSLLNITTHTGFNKQRTCQKKSVV